MSGGRLALVIGSQCPRLGMLSFLPEARDGLDVAALSGDRRLVVGLRDLLVDPLVGGCDAVVGSGLTEAGLLVNPTRVEADQVLTAALGAAHEAQAVLVVHFLGPRMGGGGARSQQERRVGISA